MENKSNLQPVLPTELVSKQPRPKRQGKSSKARNVEKFRARKNAEVTAANLKELDKVS